MNKDKYYNPFAVLGIREEKPRTPEKPAVRGTGNTDAAAKRFCLLRMDTNEYLYLPSGQFRIGKRPDMCDYVIQNNATISRTHATFQCFPNGVSVTDNQSTNKTFVNGNPIPPNMPVGLNPNDRVRLSDVEFVLLLA